MLIEMQNVALVFCFVFNFKATTQTRIGSQGQSLKEINLDFFKGFDTDYL